MLIMIETRVACVPISSYQRMVNLVETSKYGRSMKHRDSNVLL